MPSCFYFLPIGAKAGETRKLVYRFFSTTPLAQDPPDISLFEKDFNRDGDGIATALEKHHDDPWIWVLTAEIPSDSRSIEISVKVNGQTIQSDTIELQNPGGSVKTNAPSKMKLITDTPRLCIGVNRTFVTPNPGAGLNFASPGVAEVKHVLKHISDRLMGGLENAFLGPWQGDPPAKGKPAPSLGPDCRRMSLLNLSDFTQEERTEEEWAQAAAEKFCAMLYGNPRQVYLGLTSEKDEGENNKIFVRMSDDADPVWPLVAACQQSCTMAFLSRGFDVFPGGNLSLAGCDASEGTKQVVERVGGQWFDPPTATRTPQSDIRKCHVSPGSVYVFRTDDNVSRHIAFVLRVDSANRRLQLLDTGGMNTPNFEPAALFPSGMSNIKDYVWVEGQIPGPRTNGSAPPGTPAEFKADFKGLGVLASAANKGDLQPPSAKPLPDLAAATKRMRRARPLGFARLVLRLRSNKSVLFASPRLRMHIGGNDQSFSLTRYMWSLRELPGLANIQAAWEIEIPRKDVAKEMIKPNQRGLTVAQIVAFVKSKPPVSDPMDTSLPILDVLSDADPAGKTLNGRICISRTNPIGLDALTKPATAPRKAVLIDDSWTQTSGALASQIDSASDSFLDYFKGKV